MRFVGIAFSFVWIEFALIRLKRRKSNAYRLIKLPKSIKWWSNIPSSFIWVCDGRNMFSLLVFMKFKCFWCWYWAYTPWSILFELQTREQVFGFRLDYFAWNSENSQLVRYHLVSHWFRSPNQVGDRFRCYRVQHSSPINCNWWLSSKCNNWYENNTYKLMN